LSVIVTSLIKALKQAQGPKDLFSAAWLS